MKITLLPLVALAVACTAVPPQETSNTAETPSSTTTAPAEATGVVPMRILANGAYGRGATTGNTVERRAPFVLVAETREKYAELWKQYIGDETPQAVDFGRETAVFLLMGTQSTGGYAIEPHGAKRNGDGLTVDATLIQPMGRTITSMALSAPYAVIAVQVRGTKSVEWENEKRLLARVDTDAQ